MPQHPMIGCNRQKRHQPQIHGEVNSTMLVADVTEFFYQANRLKFFLGVQTLLWAIRTSVVSYDMRTCVALFTIQVRLKIMTLYSIWCCWVPTQMTARKVDVMWCLSMRLDFTLVNCSVLGCKNFWTFMRVFFWDFGPIAEWTILKSRNLTRNMPELCLEMICPSIFSRMLLQHDGLASPFSNLFPICMKCIETLPSHPKPANHWWDVLDLPTVAA